MAADRNVVAVCVFYASLYFVIVLRVNADSEKGHTSTCMQNISIGINIVSCKSNETETANPEKSPLLDIIPPHLIPVKSRSLMYRY